MLRNRKEQETLLCGAYSLVKGLQTALVMVPVSAVAPIARACEKRLALPRQDASIASASVQELPLAVPLCVFPGISCSDGPQSGRTGPSPGTCRPLCLAGPAVTLGHNAGLCPASSDLERAKSMDF